MFGDYRSDESPESEVSADGTTPSEPAAGTESDPASATTEAAADGATETPGDGTTPAAALETSADTSDPFQDTTAASFVVNGQTIPVEDIRVFKEGGAVIRPESLPNVLAKLAERETLSQESRQAKQQYDTLNKVIEWTDPSGKTLTGADAAIENRIANAALFAENSLMLPVLTAGDLQPYLTTKKVAGEDGVLREVVIFRPDFLAGLSEKATFQRQQADFAIRKHYAGVMASVQAAPAPIDFPTASKATISAIAQQSKLDDSVLTPADHVLLAKQLPAHTKDGSASMAWQELVKDRIQLRAEQKASSAKLVTTTTDATKKAQANMAAAARGVRPTVTQKPATPQRPVSPKQERLENEGDALDLMLRASSKAMRANL